MPKQPGNKRIRASLAILLLFLCSSSQVNAQDYFDRLLRNLQGIAFPLDYAVLVGLDGVHDYKSRIDAIVSILEDRDDIHSRSDINYYVKTEIICNALHLLDPYDIPRVDGIIQELNGQQNWEKREKALLAFLSAKRDIHYDANVAYLLESLPEYERELNSPSEKEVAWVITDITNCLSYLGDLFILKGDVKVLETLFDYTSVAFGYPAEYFSTRLVFIFLKRPELFVSALADNSDEIINDVTNSLVFGIRDAFMLESIVSILQDKLDNKDARGSRLVISLRTKLETLHRQENHESEVGNR